MSEDEIDIRQAIDDMEPVREDYLWAAFKAGFAESREGYNAQYGSDPNPDEDQDLREAFEKWVAA